MNGPVLIFVCSPISMNAAVTQVLEAPGHRKTLSVMDHYQKQQIRNEMRHNAESSWYIMKKEIKNNGTSQWQVSNT
jgi:hypothetical protein